MSELSENAVKHLEMIQAVVTRLAQNSFAYKAWAVTLVSAILALAINSGAYPFILVALLPTLVFWGLDAYYLRQERLFRRLYDVVRGAYPDASTPAAFSMKAEAYKDLDPKVESWVRLCLSPSEACLYGPIVIVIAACAIALVAGCPCKPVPH
jgi:hypothetical protein